MITKKQRKLLHALERANKMNARDYQRWLQSEGSSVKRVPRWRKLIKRYDYRGKVFVLPILPWERF